MPRRRIDLCGLWRFQPDSYWVGERAGFYAPEHDARLWREVRVPCCFEACVPGMDAYEGAGWFRRVIRVPEEWRGNCVVLRFEGICYHTTAWVNGERVGENRDGFLPFEFPVAEFLDYGGDNVIVVATDNRRLKGEVPGEQRGWRSFGGFHREVELLATDPLRIDGIGIDAEPTDAGGALVATVEVANDRPDDASAGLAVDIIDSSGGTVASWNEPIEIAAGNRASVSTTVAVPGAQPWSPDSPTLYRARVSLRLGGEEVDQREERFGFRKVEARDDLLLLNGEPIYLTGWNRHEDSPITDMATDLETTRWDLVEMKDAGANFVRLCHYPHHPGELDLCDELGLLVMDEIPLYWWDGNQEGEENCAAKYTAAERQLRRMIARDRNHPSVIFWSVSNETQEQYPEVAEGNRKLIRVARDLDRTRLCVHASFRWHDHANFGEDDVVCVNAYPSLGGIGREGLSHDFAKSAEVWREGLAELHNRYPGKPILITEFGHCSFEGTFGNAFGEDVMARAIEHQFAAMQAEYICGATIWCWADHAWPAETFRYASACGLGISPYGVVSRARRKQKAYWASRRMFRERQGLPVREGDASPGEPEAVPRLLLLRDSLQDLPLIPFPDGYTVRPMRLDESGLWLDIVRSTPEFSETPPGTFEREFGADLQAVQWRCFVVTDERDVAVGTVSAWYDRDFEGRDWGCIAWLAIRPEHRSQGLEAAAMSFALSQLAQWHDRCYVIVHPNRQAEIEQYGALGFSARNG